MFNTLYTVQHKFLMVTDPQKPNLVSKVREVCEDLSARVLEGAVHLVHTDAPLLFDNDLIKVYR